MEKTTEVTEYWTEQGAKRGLSPEQIAQVVSYRTDPWWCNSDDAAKDVMDFLKWLNEQQFERDLATLHADCGPLCVEHGDVRDHSAALR